MSAPEKPRVIIFSDHLLYPSETFIQAQASALSRFEPIYAGSRRVTGLDLRGEQIHVINNGDIQGKCRELTFKLAGFAPALVKSLGALNPVLLHAHYGPNGLRTLPIARNLKIPHIVTFHGSDVTVADLRTQKFTLGFRHYWANKRKLKESGALFLAVSKFLRGKLLEQGFPEERVLVHYTGVDTKKFRPASGEKGPLILFVGRLERVKGAEYLIRAAAEVQKQMPAAELVLIGEGSLRPSLEKLAKQLLRRYRFLGVRTPEEVREWMTRSSVVCVPSVKRPSGEEEAFGMVCAEAQAVGKPVVAFHTGGISEIVQHGHTGFLAPEGDWRELAKYCFWLLQDSNLKERFGATGREWVLRHLDLEHCTKQLERVYEKVSDPGTASSDEELCLGSAVNYCF